MTEPSLKHPSLNIVIACGGTGGHLFPGIAVAQELKKRGHRVTLLISQKKVDAQASKNYGDLDFRTIEAIAMPKIPSLSLLGFGVRLYKAIRFSRHLLDEVEADVVIGMGGFTSFPPVYAAHRKGIRTYVHDSNALPGKANRMTAKCCTNVLLGIEEARHYFNPAKCIVTGTPVRQEMVARKDKNEARAELNLPQDRRVALVMGGSQGARNLNSLVIEAARQCADLCDFLIITGSADFARVSQLTADMPHVHVIEFCSAMAAAYAAADVVISRSGASSLTELARMGKAALLVPYPFAADDHQAHNARVFAAHGAARMMRENTLTSDDIAAFLNEVLKDSSLLASMNECALRLDMPDAVSRIANVIEHTDHAASHDCNLTQKTDRQGTPGTPTSHRGSRVRHVRPGAHADGNGAPGERLRPGDQRRDRTASKPGAVFLLPAFRRRRFRCGNCHLFQCHPGGQSGPGGSAQAEYSLHAPRGMPGSHPEREERGRGLRYAWKNHYFSPLRAPDEGRPHASVSLRGGGNPRAGNQRPLE